LPDEITTLSAEAEMMFSPCQLPTSKDGLLRGIQLARESQVTAPLVHQQQQQLMMDFFQMSDD
jgi:hypothetical protein